MERTHRIPDSQWRYRLAALIALAAMLLAGCGKREDDFQNNPRPPAPINVAAYISGERVSVSPASFGAGPIVVIVTNQSGSSQEATIAGGQVTQTTGPINPGDTGEIKVFVREGTYTLEASGGGIAPATLRVSAERKSAQNEVLQP